MNEKLLDESTEIAELHYSSRNANISIAKGVLGFVVVIAIVAYYLWCNSNLIAFTSGRAEGIIKGYPIYALLLIAYSLVAILLGAKMKKNDQRACQRLATINAIVQIVIALLLAVDWWFTFEINVL